METSTQISLEMIMAILAIIGFGTILARRVYISQRRKDRQLEDDRQRQLLELIERARIHPARARQETEVSSVKPAWKRGDLADELFALMQGSEPLVLSQDDTGHLFAGPDSGERNSPLADVVGNQRVHRT